MSSTTTERPAPAGWYPHPSMASTRRYWNGQAWTSHIAPDDVEVDQETKVGAEKGSVAAAERLVLTIATVKWILVFLFLAGAFFSVIFAIVPLANDSSDLPFPSTATFVFGACTFMLWALLTWVLFGWAEHVLGMLATIARRI